MPLSNVCRVTFFILDWNWLLWNDKMFSYWILSHCASYNVFRSLNSCTIKDSNDYEDPDCRPLNRYKTFKSTAKESTRIAFDNHDLRMLRTHMLRAILRFVVVTIVCILSELQIWKIWVNILRDASKKMIISTHRNSTMESYLHLPSCWAYFILCFRVVRHWSILNISFRYFIGTAENPEIFPVS